MMIAQSARRLSAASILLTILMLAWGAARAAQWFRAAAEQNHSRAPQAIATYYEEGKGVPRDLVRAAEWFRT